MQTFDPGLISAIVAGNPITGFAKGTFVEVEQDEDTFALVTGSQGDQTVVRSRNQAGKVTFTLMQTSPSNDVLDALHATHKATGVPPGACSVKDLLGSTLLGGSNCFLSKPAPTSFADTGEETRKWVIIVPKLEGTTGGSPDL